METPPLSDDFLGSSILTVSTISRVVISFSRKLKRETHCTSGSGSGSAVSGMSLIISAGADEKNEFRCSAISNGSCTSTSLIKIVLRVASLFDDFSLTACLMRLQVFFSNYSTSVFAKFIFEITFFCGFGYYVVQISEIFHFFNVCRCGRCRIQTRDLCPRCLVHYQ